MRHEPMVIVAAVLAPLAACASPLDLEDVAGSYSVAFDPPLAIESIERCERVVSYSILSFGTSGFSLSTNVIENCSRYGDGYAYWEVYVWGSVTVHDETVIAFTPGRDNPAGSAPFTGMLDGEYIVIDLPGGIDSLAANALTLRLGPRQPFS